MNQPNSEPTDKDRKGRLVFLGIIIVVAFGVYFFQQFKEPSLPNWTKGIESGLKQAKQENKLLLVFFMSKPPSAVGQGMIQTTLSIQQNKKAIDEGNFVRTKQSISPDSQIAKQYKITEFPTMLILNSNGNELNRREGFIGEVAFRSEFLSLEIVHKPSANR